MSLTPTFTTHPRALQRIRDYTPAVGGGWKCAECAKGNASGRTATVMAFKQMDAK